MTITDPTNPLFGSTLAVVCRATSGSNRHLIVRLPNGRTRSVPLKATEPRAKAGAEPAVLLPISARTLLPLARRLQAMARMQEEAVAGGQNPRKSGE